MKKAYLVIVGEVVEMVIQYVDAGACRYYGECCYLLYCGAAGGKAHLRFYLGWPLLKNLLFDRIFDVVDEVFEFS